MRNLLLQLHTYVAVLAAAFIIVLGLTGSVMAFESELDELVNPGLYRIPATTAPPMTLSALRERVERACPGEQIAAIGIPETDRSSTPVILASGTEVFVNGTTGTVVGTRRGPTLLGIVHQLHLRLLAGATGAAIMGAAGVAMLLLVLSGIVLWWRYKTYRIPWTGTLFRKMFDLHTAAGIYAVPILLMVSATGVTIAYERSIGPWLYGVTGTKPIPRGMPSAPREGGLPITPDRALTIAREALPGAAPIAIGLPLNVKGSYTVRMHFPEDRTPGGRSWVCIDQYRGSVLVAQNSRTAPGPTRAMMLNRALHTGDVFGMVSKIVMAMTSLLVVVQTVSGVIMWWTRRRKMRAATAAGA